MKNNAKRKTYPPRIDPLTGETFIPKVYNQRFANSDNRIRFNNNKHKIKEEPSFQKAPTIEEIKKRYPINLGHYPKSTETTFIDSQTFFEFGEFVFGVMVGCFIFRIALK